MEKKKYITYVNQLTGVCWDFKNEFPATGELDCFGVSTQNTWHRGLCFCFVYLFWGYKNVTQARIVPIILFIFEHKQNKYVFIRDMKSVTPFLFLSVYLFFPFTTVGSNGSVMSVIASY